MKYFSGPNLYSTRPVVVERLTGESLQHHDPRRVERRLKLAYAGWLGDCPSTDQLDPVHAIALVAAFWCKGLLNSVRGLIDSAGAVSPAPGVAWLWVGYHVPELTAQAIRLASDVVAAAAADGPTFPDESLARRVSGLQALCRRQHPDYVARILMLAARADDIPVRHAAVGRRYWQYGWGCNGRVYFEAAPGTESILGHRLAGDKHMTNRFLRQLGFPATEQRLAKSQESALTLARELGWPVVVKPNDSGKGRGVTVGISTELRLIDAYAQARKRSAAPIVIERFISGFEHRLLVVRGVLVGATRREPPSVSGDGVHSIDQLVDSLNLGRTGGLVTTGYLRPVEKQPALIEHLASQGHDLASVPAPGQCVQLRGNSNMSTGGTYAQVLAEIHPEVRAMAQSIAANAGLEVIGIDYITPDITRSFHEVPSAVIEINGNAGIETAIGGASLTEVAMGRIVLGDAVGRIPVVLVIAAEPDQRQMLVGIESLRAMLPAGTALLGPDTTRIGSLRIADAGRTVSDRVGQVLANVQCTVAVFFCSAQQIADHGFPVDRCALAVWRGDVATPAESAAFKISTQSAQRMRVVGADEAWPQAEVIEQVVACLAGDSR